MSQPFVQEAVEGGEDDWQETGGGLAGKEQRIFYRPNGIFCCWPNDFLTKIICNSAQNPFKG